MKKGEVDQLLVGKQSALLVKKVNKQPMASTVYVDTSLQDRLIQNLLEEKMVLETEIGLYKGLKDSQQMSNTSSMKKSMRPHSSKVKSVPKMKMEGHDFQRYMQINTPSSVVWGAKARGKQSFRHLAVDESSNAIEEKYLQGLMRENFLLQQQFEKLQRENENFNPRNRQRN